MFNNTRLTKKRGVKTYRTDKNGNLIVPPSTLRSRRKKAATGNIANVSRLLESQVGNRGSSNDDYSATSHEDENFQDTASETSVSDTNGRLSEIDLVENELECRLMDTCIAESDDNNSDEDDIVDPGVRLEDDLSIIEHSYVLVALEKWRSFHLTKQQLMCDLKAFSVLIKHTMPAKETRLPATFSQLTARYRALSTTLKLHYICPEHACLVGSRLPHETTLIDFECDFDMENQHIVPLQTMHQSCFLTVDLEETLRNTLEKHQDKVLECMRNRRTFAPEVLDDIVCGKVYRDLMEEMGEDNMWLTLLVHADGAKLSKSSSLKAYAIHVVPVEIGAISRLVSGILHTLWVGQGRDMPDRHLLWKQFLLEMESLSRDGLVVTLDGKRYVFKVFVVIAAADAMERFVLAGLSIFHARFGCTQCKICTTTWKNPTWAASHHQVYLYSEIPATFRTDSDIATRSKRLLPLDPTTRDAARKDPYFEGVTEVAPLYPLRKFRLVSGLPVTFMHLFLNGLLPKVIGNFTNIRGLYSRLDARNRNLDFHSALARKSRTYVESPSFKANEWLVNLVHDLYTFYGIITAEEFNLLGLLISVATTATKDVITPCDIAKLHEECPLFVKGCQEQFGDEFMVYNVHCVLHIPTACENFGSMAGFCELAYEDWLGKLIRNIKGYNQIVREVANSLLLHRIADQLAVRLSKEDLPDDIVNLLTDITHIRNHRNAVKVGNCVLLGKPDKIRRLQKTDNPAFTALLIAAAEYAAISDVGAVGMVYYKLIINGYIVSAKESFSDGKANSLIYCGAEILSFTYAVQHFVGDVAVGPTFLLCKSASNFDLQPYGLPWHLPWFTVISWSDNIVGKTSEDFSGIAMEMPYHFEQHTTFFGQQTLKLGCRLPSLLFRMD